MALLPMGKTILSSMFRKSATVSYPVSPMKKDPLVRGHVEVVIEECIFCGLCSRKCPTGAITVTKAEKEWSIERFNCIVCNSCVEVCPKKCIHMNPELTRASETKTKDVVKDARVSVDA